MSPRFNPDRPPHTPGLKNCPCRPCLDRQNAAARRRRRLKAYGRWEPFTDAEPVRQHVRLLMSLGVGWQRSAKLAGVTVPVVSRLLYGVPSLGQPPARRIRTETAAALLALRPGLDLLHDNGMTDATGTRRRVQALVCRGFPGRFIGHRLGAGDNIQHTVRRSRVRAWTARAMMAIYEELKDAKPDEYGISQAAQKRARNQAAKNGWFSPDYWDDDTIDDPDFVHEFEKQTRQQAIVEDAKFVAKDEHYIRENIARRLGITPDYLDRAIDRAGGVYVVFGRGLDSPRVYS